MAATKKNKRKILLLWKPTSIPADIIDIPHPADAASRVSRRTSEDSGLSRVNPCRRASARVKWA